MKQMKQIDWKTLFEKYKFVLLVIVAGAVLFLIPSGSKAAAEEAVLASDVQSFDLLAFEKKLADILSEIDGAGKVEVALTVQGTTRQVFAQDNKQSLRDTSNELSESTVVVSRGSGTQEAVLVETVYPKFQGAVVVCQGGNDPAVKLKIMEAVSALTGLGSDKISICKSN